MRGHPAALAVVLSAILGVFSQAGSAKDLVKIKNSDLENIGNRNINSGQVNFISLAKELALGQQLAQEVERSSKLLDDSEVSEYVNRIGQALVRNSDARVP